MLLSIITINYNNLEGLRKTAESVLSQSNQNFEWIIVDGASTDGGVDYIHSISRSNTIKLSERDAGIYNAMNKGTRLAHGKYLQFLNSGDALAEPDCIDNLLKVILEHPNKDFYRCHAYLTLNGNRIGKIIAPETSLLRSGLFWFNGFISHQSTIVRRQRLLDSPYDEQYILAGDYDFFVKEYMTSQYEDYVVDIFLCDFDNAGRTQTMQSVSYTERHNILRRLWGENVYNDYVAFVTGRGAHGSYFLRMFSLLNRTKFKRNIGIVCLFLPYSISVFSMILHRRIKRIIR